VLVFSSSSLEPRNLNFDLVFIHVSLQVFLPSTWNKDTGGAASEELVVTKSSLVAVIPVTPD